jgi:acyl-CoA synthetase (AMP-forming)/AMP-acid ligase II
VARAYVVRRSGDAVAEAPLIEWCREHMANYKVPRDVQFVDELPLTASGKVQRFRLRPTGA